MATDESITLDGRLDEDAWMRAVPATNFLQRDPDNGQPATEQTEVRFVYDADKLYMGVTLFDSEPDKLTRYQMGRGRIPSGRRQAAVGRSTPSMMGQSAYWWEMNPSGSMADALRGANNTNNRRWDGIWDARSTRSDIGWTLEIEVPFRTMNFNPNSDGWGVNFQRTIPRKNEVSLWMGWLRNQGLNRMSNAGLLTGIRDVTQGRGLDIKPYLVGTSESFPGRDDVPDTIEAQAGVDLFYNITPSLRTNLTVNTDFAQTQVDTRQTNLTRFSLLFPEQRDFFLDGSLFFNFETGGGGGGGRGGGRQTLIPFQSRRIGLDEENRPQAINFGGKLTGQAGAFDIGVLQVQTGDETEQKGGGSLGEDFTVVRLKRRMFRESHLGTLYTLRHTRRGVVDDRQTIGADLRLATSTFRGSDNLSVTGYFLRTTNPLDTVGKSSAFGAETRLPQRPIGSSDRVPGDPGELRRGRRVHSPNRLPEDQPADELLLRDRGQHAWIRRFNFGAEMDWFLDPVDNRLLTREIDITALQIDTHSQDSIQVHVLPTYELLGRDFTIAPDVTLPTGQEYGFTRYSVQGRTAPRRPISLSPEVEWGEFFSGDRLATPMRPSTCARRLDISTPSHMSGNRVTLAEGEFTTSLYRAIAENAVQPQNLTRQQRAIRYAKRDHWLASALSVDCQAGQRFLFRLHPQLAGRSGDGSGLHARPSAVLQRSCIPTGFDAGAEGWPGEVQYCDSAVWAVRWFQIAVDDALIGRLRDLFRGGLNRTGFVGGPIR